MSKDDNDNDGGFENLEKWKQFENMEFTRTFEREKWNRRERTAEDEEIDSCTFENLDALFKTKNIEILSLPETKREVYLAQKLNERHNRQMKENEAAYCTFFMKTGACRYGMQCKRAHIIPISSETILIDHMYKDAYNKMTNINKSLEDSLLEIDENEIQKQFEEFYEDVFPEWRKFGKIVQFKCCNNLVSHLRGNVFIQYENIESAIIAKVSLDGRFYGGHPLHVNFSLIKDWKQAICAYNGPEMSSCPKFSECNFLHVYKNPRNEFPLERRSQEREKKPRRFDNNGPQRRNFEGQDRRPNNYDRPRHFNNPTSQGHHERRRSKERKDFKRKDRSRSRSRSRSGDRRHSHKRSHHRRRSHSKERERGRADDRHHHHKKRSGSRSRS